MSAIIASVDARLSGSSSALFPNEGAKPEIDWPTRNSAAWLVGMAGEGVTALGSVLSMRGRLRARLRRTRRRRSLRRRPSRISPNMT